MAQINKQIQIQEYFPANDLILSAIGIEQLKRFENCKLKSYQDPAGVWTNGYGNTYKVKPNSTITQAQADRDFITHLAYFEDVVNHAVSVKLSQNRFDALVSFVFNVGTGAFKASTLLKKLNAGDFAGAQAEFARWNLITDPKTKKKMICEGLTNRRLAEARLFGLDTPIKPVIDSRTLKTAATTVVSGLGSAALIAPEVIKDNLSLFGMFTDWRIILPLIVIACGIFAGVLKLEDRKMGK